MFISLIETGIEPPVGATMDDVMVREQLMKKPR